MKRATYILAALLVAGAALADDKKQARDPSTQPVVVDPIDLRQPVPDPEKELSQKYDGQLVRFTGRVRNWGQDSMTKTYWYNLETAVPTVSAKAKKDANAQRRTNDRQEQVVVKVLFQQDDRRLRTSQGRTDVTVVGKGEITSDGSLIIHQAEVLAPQAR
jgi:hypothetical protein